MPARLGICQRLHRVHVAHPAARHPRRLRHCHRRNAYRTRIATLAFREVGITLCWEGQGVDEKGIDTQTGKVLVEVDPKYFRPAEVEQLLGDPTKAKTLLGWNPRQTSFEELVRIMAEHDMKFVKKLYLRSKEL